MLRGRAGLFAWSVTALAAPTWLPRLVDELAKAPSTAILGSDPHDVPDDVQREIGEIAAEDPYLFIPFDILEPPQPVVPPLVNDTEHVDSAGLVAFAETYAFPEKFQVPTSMGTVPAKLMYNDLVDDGAVYLQLNDYLPKSLCPRVKPDVGAIRRVLSEFANMSAVHRDRYFRHYDEGVTEARREMALQHLPSQSDADMLRFMTWRAREAFFEATPFYDFLNSQELFIGEWDDPEKLLEKFDLSPFLFSIPFFRAVADPNATAPNIAGPGLATSLYRTIYSKSLIFVQAHMAAEVRLPARDPEALELLWSDVTAPAPPPRVAVFARVMWADNQRMCGGGGLLREFNAAHNTEFAPDMPVDAAAALRHLAVWAERPHDLLGVLGMRQRVAELADAAATAGALLPAHYPSTADVPSPEYTVPDQLGMHLQYLAHLNDPTSSEVARFFASSPHASVRMGAAKAALTAGDKQLYRSIVAAEPPGRNKHYMTTLARKRKKRDLTDEEPRILDEQFEFAAPIYTGSKQRLDPSRPEDRRLLQRLHHTGRISRNAPPAGAKKQQ